MFEKGPHVCPFMLNNIKKLNKSDSVGLKQRLQSSYSMCWYLPKSESGETLAGAQSAGTDNKGHLTDSKLHLG